MRVVVHSDHIGLSLVLVEWFWAGLKPILIVFRYTSGPHWMWAVASLCIACKHFWYIMYPVFALWGKCTNSSLLIQVTYFGYMYINLQLQLQTYFMQYISINHSSSSIYVDWIALVANVICYFTISTLNKYLFSYLFLSKQKTTNIKSGLMISLFTHRKREYTCSTTWNKTQLKSYAIKITFIK